MDCFWQPSWLESSRLGKEGLGLQSMQDEEGLINRYFRRSRAVSLCTHTVVAKTVSACVVIHGHALWDQGVPGVKFGLDLRQSGLLGRRMKHSSLVSSVRTAGRSACRCTPKLEQDPYKAVSNRSWRIWVSFTISRNRAPVEISKLALVGSTLSRRSSGTSSSNLKSSMSRFEVVYEAR